MNTERLDRRGTIFILISVIGYSLIPIWVKTIQNSGLLSLDIVTWRFIIATPLFWLLARQRSTGETRTGRQRLQMLSVGLLLAAAAITGFWGLERLSPGTYVVLFYTYPAMVALLSLLMGEKLPLRAWLALGLTSIGIVLATPDVSAGLSGDNLPGVLLALVNALIVAIYFIINARLLKGQQDTTEAGALSITGALIIYLLLVPFRAVQAPQTSTSWLFMFGLAALSTVLPVFFLNAGIQKVGAARASILSTAEPLMTFIFSAIFLGERMQLVQIIGGLFIIMSVVLLQLPAKRSPDETT